MRLPVQLSRLKHSFDALKSSISIPDRVCVSVVMAVPRLAQDGDDSTVADWFRPGDQCTIFYPRLPKLKLVFPRFCLCAVPERPCAIAAEPREGRLFADSEIASQCRGSLFDGVHFCTPVQKRGTYFLMTYGEDEGRMLPGCSI